MRRRIAALFMKELRSLFASPIAYVVLTAFVSLSAVYFFQHLISYNQLLFAFQSEGLATTDFDQGTVPLQINTLNELFMPFAGDLHLFLLAVIPLITMRVFAEERATGTDELLLTTPLRTWELALAKHATTYLFVMLLLGVSAIYPAVIISKSQLGMAHLGALYLGQLAYGVAIAAIGLACSSLTRSQVVAAIVAYAVPFILLDFAWLDPVLTESAAGILSGAAIQPHLDNFARGVLEFRHAVYFGGLTVLGFTVSVASLELVRAR
ncbi:MAG: ABC transporter permease [Deltaproteobacteria bacterium]|nr:ABC transporter permease [Deltaproteobacteria bacterium]MBW2413458.1 ABC transporter permease [Deltaproteobacteria bacterium]